MNYSQRLAIGIIALLVGIFVGFSRNTKKTTLTTRTLPHYRYALNIAFSGAPAFADARNTWKRIGDTTPGVKTIYGGPLNGDSSKQIEELDNLIENKVNGIVLYPSDPGTLVTTIDKAMAHGIPVVTLFSDVSSSKRLTCVEESEIESGRRIARKVFTDFPKLLQDKNCGILISIANPGMENQRDRREGIVQVINEMRTTHPGLQLLDTVSDGIDENKAAEAIQASLARNGDKVRVIFGCDSRSAVGAVSALKSLQKKPGEIVVTGWDSDRDLLDLIAPASSAVPWVHATVVLYVSAMTQTAYSFLQSYNLGYASKQEIPPHILVPVNLVDKNNIAAYRK